MDGADRMLRTALRTARAVVAVGVWCCAVADAAYQSEDATQVVLSDASQEIRNAEPREWATFAESGTPRQYQLVFESAANETAWTIQLVQIDVREAWVIRLNGTELGQLYRDENAIVGFWHVPAGVVRSGPNTLSISTRSERPDDVRIGRVILHHAERTSILNQSQIQVSVTEAGRTVPCRITVLENGQLLSIGAKSNEQMAVRPGVIYCRGNATWGLPAGRYTVIAGRGPEYSIAVANVEVMPGELCDLQLTLERVVDTAGYIACDTHVHTLTHSGHGDATEAERMLTLAGECVELAVATDHNKHIDYTEMSERMQTSQWFTSVIGNEVTTKRGHFNIFPVAAADTPVPDFGASNWKLLDEEIRDTPHVRLSILNHAQDIHSGFRPFDPAHHIQLTGRCLDGQTLPANAMEIINSAAQQSEMMTLVHDWMGMLNAGRWLIPVGSSDSHDVARHFVGQGRTYIQCHDQDVSQISVDEACINLLAGRVSVSCGLIADVRVNQDFGPGDLAAASPEFDVEVDVKGAGWVEATSVDIYVNGQLWVSEQIPQHRAGVAGLKHTVRCSLEGLPPHDVFLVAVAQGPGVEELYWPIARPYQSTSIVWEPRCMAVTGAVWLDVDDDGRRSCARDYAVSICQEGLSDLPRIMERLREYDYAVAVHVAEAVMQHDTSLFHDVAIPQSRRSGETVRRAFTDYRDAWRASELARAER